MAFGPPTFIGDAMNFYEMEKMLLKRERNTESGLLSFSSLFNFYRNKCYRMLFGAFDFTGIPESWDFDYFLVNLFSYGYVGICDTPIGVIPLRCGLTGINAFDHPTTAIFANAVLGNFERSLFSENPADACALIRIQYDYHGVNHLIEKYSSQLAEIDNSISVNLRNSKVAQVFFADSKQQAATLQKLYRDIDSGRPVVTIKNDNLTPEGIYFNHVRETYIASDLQLLKADIINDFLTDIGLNNTNMQKRERLIVDEVNANNEEIQSNVEHWLKTITKGFERANQVFNLELAVKLRKYRRGEGMTNENVESDAD